MSEVRGQRSVTATANDRTAIRKTPTVRGEHEKPVNQKPATDGRHNDDTTRLPLALCQWGHTSALQATSHPKRLPPHLAWVGPYFSREHKASLHRHEYAFSVSSAVPKEARRAGSDVAPGDPGRFGGARG
ncbi:MAG: hypothetical protein ACLFWL_17085 [Candidatus Brocadiia bacterium]